jgi:hypothetical protein
LFYANARAFSPHELPKARLCANVILAAVDGENGMGPAVAQLKQGLGNNWSVTTVATQSDNEKARQKRAFSRCLSQLLD